MASADGVEQVPLHRATADRYLQYALSVITSRALPDVRDGLKPVQRRILYAMHHDLNLRPDGRYKKCASVVGTVLSNYHPHGDQSVYDTLVRLAQDFTLLHPLIDGQGNFGSLDGDPPAAYRYTECKLRPLAVELLSEIKKQTVDFRATFDGQREEPTVLPAQFPHLLVTGCEGIAVGMATKIPPHNLGEVIDATVAMIAKPDMTVVELLRHVQGPDFPTGGRIVATTEEIQRIYERGQGSLKVRATWEVETSGRRTQVILTSIPYGQNKSKLVEHIGSEVQAKRLPQVVDVRDESTTDVRIVLDLKQGASAEAVMAYLFRRTNLQATWSVNMTALVPTSGGGISTPERLDLQQTLRHWLDFRFDTVRRRYTFDLEQLLQRIHILEGFEAIFDSLDEALALIRDSEGKKDAAEKLQTRFGLSELQTEAVLTMPLYRIAKLEIHAITEELADKRTAAGKLERILKSDKRLWTAVKKELLEIRKIYAEERRTIVGMPMQQLEFSEDAYIVNEDGFVVVTRDGWVKRQTSFSDISKIRLREDDSIGWLFLANTRSTVTLLTSHGSAYTLRVDGIPATTGYGEPLSAKFSFADGERVVGVVPHDERHDPPQAKARKFATGDDPKPPHGIAITSHGRMMRFPLSPHVDPSNKSGRRYARLNEGDQVFCAFRLETPRQKVCVATHRGKAAVFPVTSLPVLKSPGKGVGGVKLDETDHVMACELAVAADEGPAVTTSRGRTLVVNQASFGSSTYGGRGKVVLKKGTIELWQRQPELWLGPETEDGDSGAEPTSGGDA